VEDEVSRAELVGRMHKALTHCTDPWRESNQKLKEEDPAMTRAYTPLKIRSLADAVSLVNVETTT
jgi:hypothetical protein